jgi:hypothetical protein
VILYSGLAFTPSAIGMAFLRIYVFWCPNPFVNIVFVVPFSGTDQ